MDKTAAERRLQSIARHLISFETINPHHLNPNPSSSADAEAVLLASSPPAPVIIGGMVLDIHAKPYRGQDAIPGTTAPGTVKFINGGVARNIAECMSKLGSRPFILSVVGTDTAGKILLNYWESAGLCTEGILKVSSAATPTVSNTFDSKGELAVGVASVEAVEKFVTPDFIQQFRHTLRSAPVVMIDANLHPRSLEAASKLATEYGVPVWFEPVSVAKSARIASIAKYITVTSPNEDELVAMANALSPGGEFRHMLQNLSRGKEQSVDSSFNMLRPAICLLLEKGIKLVILTLGANGVLICFKNYSHPLKNDRMTNFQRQLFKIVDKIHPPKWQSSFWTSGVRYSELYVFHLPALPASVVSLTGAGDCLVGGVLASICSGLDVMQSVAMGIAVAKVAVESETNVPAEFSRTAVSAAAQQIISNGRQLIPY